MSEFGHDTSISRYRLGCRWVEPPAADKSVEHPSGRKWLGHGVVKAPAKGAPREEAPPKRGSAMSPSEAERLKAQLKVQIAALEGELEARRAKGNG